MKFVVKSQLFDNPLEVVLLQSRVKLQTVKEANALLTQELFQTASLKSAHKTVDQRLHG